MHYGSTRAHHSGLVSTTCEGSKRGAAERAPQRERRNPRDTLFSVLSQDHLSPLHPTLRVEVPQKVYRPDIVEAADRIYKKPGYTM